MNNRKILLIVSASIALGVAIQNLQCAVSSESSSLFSSSSDEAGPEVTKKASKDELKAYEKKFCEDFASLMFDSFMNNDISRPMSWRLPVRFTYYRGLDSKGAGDLSEYCFHFDEVPADESLGKIFVSGDIYLRFVAVKCVDKLFPLIQVYLSFETDCDEVAKDEYRKYKIKKTDFVLCETIEISSGTSRSDGSFASFKDGQEWLINRVVQKTIRESINRVRDSKVKFC